jgi:hypothetical protein
MSSRSHGLLVSANFKAAALSKKRNEPDDVFNRKRKWFIGFLYSQLNRDGNNVRVAFNDSVLERGSERDCAVSV